jgi:hypothetical protein
MIDLSLRAKEIVFNGFMPFNATTNTLRFEFDLKLMPKTPEKKSILRKAPQETTMRFAALDGPGGGPFPGYGKAEDVELDEHQLKECREAMVNQAKRSEGLLMCVDANDENASAAFFLHLGRFFGEVGRPLPFKRIAVILTKAEKRVSYRRGADKDVANLCPAMRLQELLGESLPTLDNYKQRDVRIACGWVSTFGFVANEGSPNYDPETKDGRERLRSSQDGAPIIDKIRLWRPFRLLDPLIYLATGELGTLTYL